jgi:hypothetical protein
MNIARVQTLIAALKSGEYKKGIGALNHNDKYCCQGVGCELFIKDTSQDYYNPITKSLGEIPDQRLWEYNGRTGKWPEEVREYFGLSAYQSDQLVKLNDNSQTFEPVITYLEQEMAAFTEEHTCITKDQDGHCYDG